MSIGSKFRAVLLAAIAAAGPSCAAAVMPAQEAPERAAPKSHRMPMMRKFSYTCEGGGKVMVHLRERNARVSFREKSYAMKQVEAALGTKYSDGAIVWWSQGEQGFLEDETKPDQAVRLAENCKLDRPTGETGSAAVSGTVAYRERMALPGNALLTVPIEDVSLVDRPAKVIAEQRIEFAGKQAPLAFKLPYDASRIDPKHTYSVSARITVDDQLRFLNTSAYRVITGGHPVKVNLLRQLVGTPADGTKH
jgi:putative lipoprotein